MDARGSMDGVRGGLDDKLCDEGDGTWREPIIKLRGTPPLIEVAVTS
jgi:hypothetical protein